MKVPYLVLQKYIPKLTQTPEEVADTLSRYAYEVDKVYNPGDEIQQVVVGEIKAIEPHPDADKLQLTTVHVGGTDFLPIVCGARNIKVGDRVPVALEGAVLPGGMVIRQTAIRGQDSFGMLCSRKELGLQGDASGIFILPPRTQVGASISDVLHLNQVVIEVDNKGLGTRAADSMSFYGVARELASVMKLPLEPLGRVALPKSHGEYTIKRDTSVCSYYALLQINGMSSYEFDSNIYSQDNYRIDLYVQVESYTGDESVTSTLDVLGYNTKSPAINLGNYVMEEVGQPVHVFDVEKIEGKTITIRKSKQGETMVSLDGSTLTLEDGDIVVCDEKKIIALAGIIGSKDTAIDDGTRQIIVESASFDSNQIRKTARRLKLLTGAAKRFERGVPRELSKDALERVAWYLGQVKIPVNAFIESGSAQTPESWTELSFDYVRRYLGVDISDHTIIEQLKRIGVEVKTPGFGGGRHKLKAPYWRMDLDTPEEYIEEVARLYGYDAIPAKLDLSNKVVSHNPLYLLQRTLSETLVAQGYSEIMTYPYSDVQGKYQMLNPLDRTAPYLRQRISPGIFPIVRKNLTRFDQVRVFEIGHVFTETEDVHIALSYAEKSLDKNQCLSQVYKDFVKAIYVLGIDVTLLDLVNQDSTVGVVYNQQPIGMFDPHNQTLEISLSAFMQVSQYQRETFQPIPRFPVVKRDLTLSVPSGVSVHQVQQALNEVAPAECRLIRFVDSYAQGEAVNYTFHLQFRHDDRSLSDEEVNQFMYNFEHVTFS